MPGWGAGEWAPILHHSIADRCQKKEDGRMKTLLQIIVVSINKRLERVGEEGIGHSVSCSNCNGGR